MDKETIRNSHGEILGYIETDSSTGKKTARNFFGWILGYYDPSINSTTNFQGWVVAKGDAVSGLIYDWAAKEGRL